MLEKLSFESGILTDNRESMVFYFFEITSIFNKAISNI